MRSFSVFMAILALLSAEASANEGPVQRCKVYNWQPGDVITVEAQYNKQTSVKLPEDALDVVWGAKTLWESAFVKNYIFTKPLTQQGGGAETTMTAVGNSGNSYEFLVRRVSNMRSHCVIVTTAGALINRSNWDSRDNAQAMQTQALTAQIARLNADKAAMEKEGERKARDAVKLYRSSINTGYKWTTAEGWFAAGGAVIDSVHDDGRFTYIKLKSDNRGLMAVLGEIDGKKEVLESKYDADTRTYKVSGIFPKFTMRAGNSELVITREGA